MKVEEYRVPVGPTIGRGNLKLERLKERRNEAIIKYGEELAKILSLPSNSEEEEFWTQTMPEALLSVLESFDREAARLACKSFVYKHPEREE